MLLRILSHVRFTWFLVSVVTHQYDDSCQQRCVISSRSIHDKLFSPAPCHHALWLAWTRQDRRWACACVMHSFLQTFERKLRSILFTRAGSLSLMMLLMMLVIVIKVVVVVGSKRLL
jgi:hypothetical protein